MMKDLNYYIKSFANLKVDRASGTPAPHQPILLLSVIEQFERGKIRHNQIYLTPELIATFLKYWSNLVTTDHHSDISLPFFHLAGKKKIKFWHLMPNPGFEAVIESGTKIRGLAALRNTVKYAYLDTELCEYLQNASSRLKLSEVLVRSWFSAESQQVEKLYAVDELEEIQLRLFEKGGAVYTVEDIKDQETTFVRNAAFRRNMISLYEQRCTLCRLKIVSRDNQNVVDGAHIKPFSEFRDDRLDNGLSLCKNHHWAFDRGWFGISDKYRIIVPDGRLYEETPRDMRSLQDFDDELILLPNQEIYNPRVDALQWHRSFWKIA
ncbi:HNH endonuclease [Leptolyngbya sp. FACHB-36]|uniref:HNH endonuclease n=1 Tax=Leptolyngbya sp. FACHB-36 TaxID=2692808 RepID=UPI001681BEA9|nr:HNH endonuclease [Leptolyngbya sp. FACHB-36]MBD2021145.1 HNH endonuclease [Leptolyngbya sp. FACHB-36]